MRVHDYEKLIVWQKSMDLVESVYRTTKGFPKEEQYGLMSQMRRSAISIPSNIAEGSRRKTYKDFNQFLIIAFGSASELETQIQISRRLNYFSVEEAEMLKSEVIEILKMLNKLIDLNNKY